MLPNPHLEPMTPRELDILQSMVKGLTNAEIADKLVLSPGTVKWYVKQLYSKLDAHSRQQAIERALALNLFELSEDRSGVEAAGAANPTVTTGISSHPDTRNRYRMLRNVQSFWIDGLLEQSLHGAILIDLDLKQQPDSTAHPWDSLLRIPDLPDEILPKSTRLLSVFDRLNGKLLILGEPGSGKTTSMLDLARDLLKRAEANADYPIPVVFNLSSWSERQKALADWLIDELGGKYQVPQKIAQEWVAHDALLLLLDGFDEVAPERREACAEAINSFRQIYGFMDIVVCSRTSDYQPMITKLNLNGAVVIEPMTLPQVDGYLS